MLYETNIIKLLSVLPNISYIAYALHQSDFYGVFFNFSREKLTNMQQLVEQPTQ